MEANDSELGVSLSLGYKFVPWVNWCEWNNVRRAIFSSSPSTIATALKRISAWQSRGCLPVPVDVTARIIEIQQKDPFFRGDASVGDVLISDEMLAMLYCMSIMRLVNCFVEPSHRKTGRSISDLAEALGIPRTLVDIRHESSHRDLPSLKLVRSASIKALEWLKTNYWEPQRIAIPDPRKAIKSIVLELILCLRSRHISSGSPMNTKRKRVRSALLMPCHKLSRINKRVLASKSEGSLKQWSKITKIAALLYSLYPEEFVSLLLEFLPLQSFDISDNMEIHSDDSECSIPKPLTSSFSSLKVIITTLSNKKPMLILSLLKTVLEMIEQKESKNYENGANHFLSSQNQVEVNQTGHFRLLVPYLIRNLKTLKNSGRIVLLEEHRVPSTDISAPKISLTNLLHKCLMLLAPGDKHLLKSVLLLGEMTQNRSLTEKLRKLPLLAFLELDSFDTFTENTLLKEEDSINKAAEKLDLIKLFLNKRCCKGARQVNCYSDDRSSKWTVAKSWVPCPIGTLPCFFSSTAVIPVLDLDEGKNSEDKCVAAGHNRKSASSGQKDKIVFDFESCDDDDDVDGDNDDSSIKKLGQALQDQIWCAVENAFPMEGRLLIGGVWKKVSDAEVAEIVSNIRTFV